MEDKPRKAHLADDTLEGVAIGLFELSLPLEDGSKSQVLATSLYTGFELCMFMFVENPTDQAHLVFQITYFHSVSRLRAKLRGRPPHS